MSLRVPPGDEGLFLLHYNEIALKKGNRGFFIKRLVENLRKSFTDLPFVEVRHLNARVFISLKKRTERLSSAEPQDDRTSMDGSGGRDGKEPLDLIREVVQRISRTFGIVHFSPAYHGSLDLEDLEQKILNSVIEKKLKFDSFRISAKRNDKTFHLTSPEINARIGAFIKENLQAKVNLEAPELDIHIEVLPKQAFFYFEKYPGPGGLPAGVSGRAACLISGGIDSPVAAYHIMKRGCRLTFIHFHSYPYLDKTSQEKVVKLVQLLTPYQHHAVLYLVPFGDIQRKISAGIQPEYRVVLYRRMMVRIAEKLAIRERCKALITGESIGQVASQTLDNLTVIEKACDMPLFRPLIGMDKDEIVAAAQKIGTFQTSIIPDQDCCQLFVPRHPMTRGKLEEAEALEANFDISDMIKSSLENTERKELFYP